MLVGSRCQPALQLHGQTNARSASLAPRGRRPAILASSLQSGGGVASISNATKVELETLSDCELAVSIYPRFSYDASGYGGSGTAASAAADSGSGSGRLAVSFDASVLQVPPLDYRSTKLFGIPLPPPLKITIVPKQLQGFVDLATGEVGLNFDAEFMFTAGLYKAPALAVVTTLTSESSSGEIHSATGRRLDADGRCRLVGVARVPRTSDAFLNAFLMLPTDALAVLSAEMRFS